MGNFNKIYCPDTFFIIFAVGEFDGFDSHTNSVAAAP